MLGKDTDTHEGHDHKDHVHAPSVGYKEFCALKKAKYMTTSMKYNKLFVLRKVKTDQVVELRAASAYQACKMIGWKPRQVRLVEEKEVKSEKKKDETSHETTETKKELA